MASTGIMVKNRPTSMAMPRVVLYHWVLALRPAKAEPLLLAADGVGVDHLGQPVRAGVDNSEF